MSTQVPVRPPSSPTGGPGGPPGRQPGTGTVLLGLVRVRPVRRLLPGLLALGVGLAVVLVPAALRNGEVGVILVPDEPAYAETQRLWREQGLMVGPSTGAIVHAAGQLEGEGVAVGVSPDSGTKYTSYFAEMLGDEGLPS